MKRYQAFILITLFLVPLFSGCSSPPATTQPPGVPEPVQTLPPEYRVEITVSEKEYYDTTIPVIFAGGEGQISVSKIDISLVTSDGLVETTTLEPRKGTQALLQGTRGTDRIRVWVTLNTGMRYLVIDRTVPYRTRG
jgi:hypothetical protein